MQKKALSLAEVIIGALILATTFVGMISVFTTARRHILRANQRLVAVYLADEVLTRLYSEVREDTWDTGALSEGSPPSWSREIEESYPDVEISRNYILNYTAINVNGQNYRSVDVSVAY